MMSLISKLKQMIISSLFRQDISKRTLSILFLFNNSKLSFEDLATINSRLISHAEISSSNVQTQVNLNLTYYTHYCPSYTLQHAKYHNIAPAVLNYKYILCHLHSTKWYKPTN